MVRGRTWSRTGHGPKAANDKSPDFAMTSEATAACAAQGYSLCPPVDEEAPVLSDVPAGGEGGTEKEGEGEGEPEGAAAAAAVEEDK